MPIHPRLGTTTPAAPRGITLTSSTRFQVSDLIHSATSAKIQLDAGQRVALIG
jgi:hypothetical protein